WRPRVRARPGDGRPSARASGPGADRHVGGRRAARRLAAPAHAVRKGRKGRGRSSVTAMVRAMRYAVSIPPFTDARTIVELGREAEQAGWDGIFLWDHVQWTAGMPVHDPWVLLGALALETERALLGTMVTP